jgi:hypothetical protein
MEENNIQTCELCGIKYKLVRKGSDDSPRQCIGCIFGFNHNNNPAEKQDKSDK